MDKEEKYWKEIKEIEKKYKEFSEAFDWSEPKSTNLQREKQKFLAAVADDKVYNPQMKFPKRTYNLGKLNEFEKYKFSTKNDLYGFKKLYKKKFKAKISQLKSFINWGDPQSTKYVLEYRGKPSKRIFKKAIKHCREYEREVIRFKRITPKELGKEIQKEVKELTNRELNVSFHAHMAAKVNILSQSGEFQINPCERFTSIDLERLKVHEIGTHYMRYYNGSKMKIKILEQGTAKYLETEEGLAAYMEELKGVSSSAQLYVYAGRVIATYYSPKKSFYEVWSILTELGFDAKVAFAITFRSKRNMQDTSLPGGYTKDYVYFSGYHKVKKFAQKNDIKDLFIGKISLKDLKILREFIEKKRHKITTILD